MPIFRALSLLLATFLHPGPSLWGDFRLSEDEVVLVVEGAADPLTTNLAVPRLLLGALSEEERRECERHLERVFREGFPVELDGVRVLPTLKELIVQDAPPEDASWRSARFVLVYPCDRLPRRVSIRWDGFEGEGVDFVPMTIQRRGEAPRAFSLWPDHPEWTWHADDVTPDRPPVAAAVPSADTVVVIPVLSAALGLLALAAAVVSRRIGARLGLPVAGALAVLAVLARGEALVEWRVPWSTRATLPAPGQARAIFEALHANVYAAFAAEDEEEIYALLSESVAPELLDELYGEVYESLILRQEGGAVCTIAAVETIEGGVELGSYEEGGGSGGSGGVEFGVEWKWRVKGVVSHWGHVHRRVNRYAARYRVRHDGVGWKIAGVVVEEQVREEEGEGEGR